MSDITKKYVDYAGLQEYDSQIKGVISTDFVGATSSTDGAAGRVPAPESGDENKFLRGDGTWAAQTASGVTGVKGDAETTYRDGDVNITAANIGLGNVDNTSDVNKPISTAVANEILALQSVNAFNVVPHTAVKNTTIEDLTITNNLDGTYTINGTSPTNREIFVDLVSGMVQVGAQISYGTPVFVPFQVEQSPLIKLTLGNTNAAGLSFSMKIWDRDLTQTQYSMGVEYWQGVVTRDLRTQPFNIKYVAFGIYIRANRTYDNVTIAPACWSAASACDHPGAGALSNTEIYDYIRRYTKTTFVGTRSEWNSLNNYMKNVYQVVILNDD